MTFLAPGALWLALVGAGIVALYLLKIRRRKVTVPSLDFWKQLVAETQVRSLFRQFKRWLSLLFWLCIAACLLFAVGNPIFTGGPMKSESIAVIVDDSASMQTNETGEHGESTTRLALAKSAIADFVARRPVNDEWLLIEASSRPRVLQTWTRDSNEVLKSLDEIPLRSERGDLPAAIALAREIMSGRKEQRIIVVSDGDAGRIQKLIAGDERILHWPVGETDDNLGLTQISVRSQQSAHHVYARIDNSSQNEIETQLVFEVDDATAKVEPAKIAPRSTWEKTVVIENSSGGVLRAFIDRPDALAVDDEAWAVLEPGRAATVFLVTPENDSYFYRQALLAMDPLVDPATSQTLTPEKYEALGDLKQQADLTIFNNCLPKTWDAGQKAIFINARPKDIPARTLGRLENVEMDVARSDHPLMRYVTFRAAGIASAEQVELLIDCVKLVQSDEGQPLVYLYEGRDRQALCLAFNVLETDLPFRNSFPILLRNSLAYFTTDQPRWVRPHYLTGEVIESLRPAPASVESIAVAGATRTAMTLDHLTPRDGRFRFDATNVPGPLRFEIGDETAYSAVNLTDANETNIVPVRPGQSPDERLTLSRRIFGIVPWLAFATCAGLMICVEWLTYHFRWTE